MSSILLIMEERNSIISAVSIATVDNNEKNLSDLEIQNQNPGYAPLTRGNDYLSRRITSQNGKE
ncbi:MAG: hypothetical protein ACLR43_11130 [Faecalibacillus faecis]